MYAEDDMLPLSGIQHFRFCPRQWALIHIERQWDDNRLTAEGQAMHQHVDDPTYRQREEGHIVLRALHISSPTLGLYGTADAVELHEADNDDCNTITHPSFPGRWRPVPVEYKHGRPKQGEEDNVQLVAQAMCLEEMHHIHIPTGAIFYGETRHRLTVQFTTELRHTAEQCAVAMHQLFSRAVLPNASKMPKCRSCSLLNICMPNKRGQQSAATYLNDNLFQ